MWFVDPAWAARELAARTVGAAAYATTHAAIGAASWVLRGVGRLVGGR
jgi:hypothetical protein